MMTTRFAGVSRAARSLLNGTAQNALDAGAAAPAIAADDEAPEVETPPTEEEPEADPAPAPPEVAPAPEVDNQPESAALEGDAKIRADERTRVSEVFACEHCTGRERQAADMLQTSMSATEITSLLAKMPKGGAAADPMLASLKEAPNPKLGAGGETTTTPSQAADALWARVRPATKR